MKSRREFLQGLGIFLGALGLRDYIPFNLSKKVSTPEILSVGDSSDSWKNGDYKCRVETSDNGIVWLHDGVMRRYVRMAYISRSSHAATASFLTFSDR